MKKAKRAKYRTEFDGDFDFDYKDPTTLNKFIMDGGKIVPARISKFSLQQQKKVAREIKIARNLALLPSGTTAYDNFRGAELVSPKPFEF